MPEDHLPAAKETLATLSWLHKHVKSPSQGSDFTCGKPLGYEAAHKTLLSGPWAQGQSIALQHFGGETDFWFRQKSEPGAALEERPCAVELS